MPELRGLTIDDGRELEQEVLPIRERDWTYVRPDRLASSFTIIMVSSDSVVSGGSLESTARPKLPL
ncbi:MAG: hypothetical protein EBU46_14030, partial [Nitrosomonadaceae bacterium]|nr:hypothetical protein [Nitrosomonadaceae bacterium]